MGRNSVFSPEAWSQVLRSAVFPPFGRVVPVPYGEKYAELLLGFSAFSLYCRLSVGLWKMLLPSLGLAVAQRRQVRVATGGAGIGRGKNLSAAFPLLHVALHGFSACRS